MCGITGVLGTRSAYREDLSAIAKSMGDRLTHRGPDHDGVWCDPEAGIALAHRRLAVLDLSPAGNQPMHTACGTYSVVFNGEIYNHQEIRHLLSPASWRGHSDTETILEAFDHWGIVPTLGRLRGMFAIAVWDSGRRELVLARDRLGEKPLYYGWVGDSFVFASELKAFSAHPAWNPELDRDALGLYMEYGYVPAPFAIWRGLRKLPPGCFIRLAGTIESQNLPEPDAYWRAVEIAAVPRRRDLNDSTAIAELEELLMRSIGDQMVADVPLGAFLSGGVDSSTVVALMQAQTGRPVKTFSVGFPVADYDESHHAKRIASHLGTDHTEYMLSAGEALELMPRLPLIFDEPFADSSQIPTHLVAALARRTVTVSLSGDGGDELFGGYNRHFLGRRLWKQMAEVPLAWRSWLGQAIVALGPGTWDRIGRRLPSRLRQPAMGDRLHKLAHVIDAESPDDFYRRLVTQEAHGPGVVPGARAVPIWSSAEATAFAATGSGNDFTERMMLQDMVGYLADDILVKLDRAAMAVSLETRVPMLDHRLVEFAWSVPLHMKIRAGQGKWLLRQVLYRYVPAALIERPKQGFGVPIDSWLRADLRDWAEALLDESRLKREGFFDWRLVRRRWAEHLSGQRNRQHWLWNVLMFQAWQERWL